MSEMTKFGMPGAFAHGTFDTWSPGYLMFIGAMHNGISRLYETFGNARRGHRRAQAAAQRLRAHLVQAEPAAAEGDVVAAQQQQLPQTGLLTALSYFAGNNKLFLKNFYLKSKRSILKPKVEGPAAYVLPGRRAAAGRAGRAAARAAAAGASRSRARRRRSP